MRDLFVDSGAVRIAVRDFGGDGPPMLLLHGGGGNLAGMSGFAPLLRPAHRVLALDLRGHGHSGDGPWEWDAVLGDLEAVVEELDLGEPAVVGHSLGGMIAALWARRHPECPGAVSLDGNPPPTRPHQLAGLEPDLAAAELARLHAVFAQLAGAMAAPLGPEQVEAALAGARATARQYGADEEHWAESVRRGLTGPEDARRLRPDPECTEQLRVAMASVDLVAAYRETRCPLLLVLATEDIPQQRPFRQLYEAYRRGNTERFTEAARVNPALRVVPLPGATHAMLAERPAELAELVTRFLA